jgi:hypothetical protein
MGAGIVGWQIVTHTTTDSADKIVTVTCTDPNDSILGGGYQVTAGSSSDRQKLSVVQNYPSSNTQWTVQAVETASVASNWTLTSYAVCGVA